MQPDEKLNGIDKNEKLNGVRTICLMVVSSVENPRQSEPAWAKPLAVIVARGVAHKTPVRPGG